MWKIINKEDIIEIEKMERFVSAHCRGHFMQLPRWAEVKRCWDWRGILIHNGQTIEASMSVLIRPLPLGFSLLYAPRGLVGDRTNAVIWAELMEALKQLARERRALLLYLDPDESDENTEFRHLMKRMRFREQTDDGFGNIQPQFVFRLLLEEKTEEEVFRAFTQKTRYNIRLAQRRGVTIREYTGAEDIPDEVLDSFTALMQTTGRRDHFQARGREYFSDLLKTLGDDARLFMACYEEAPIAGTIEVFCGKKAWYLYGASANEHRDVMPNYLLQWIMIRSAMARGCALYDFRGVPGHVSEDHPLHGLYRFKKGFSGTYTSFTGLFVYSFLPLSSILIGKLMKLRKWIRSFQKS